MTTQLPSAPSPDLDGRIRRVLEEIRPFLQGDGGDMEYLGLEEGFVKIRLTGACSTCPSSVATLRSGIESRLVDEVPEVLGVASVPAR